MKLASAQCWKILCFVLLSINLPVAWAVPSFARQTGMQCMACHTVFPELTSFGRQFKLRGFTLGQGYFDTKEVEKLPIAAVLQVTQTNTSKVPEDTDIDALKRNKEPVAQAAGVYLAGKLTDNIGSLIQYNYDGIERKSGMEMFDLRYADSGELNGKDLLFGLTLNNTPTVSDIFNSTPVWSFPNVQPASVMATTPVIDMTLASQVGGVGVYGLMDNTTYGELAFYRNAARGIMRPLGAGVKTESIVQGYSPYWRFAYQKDIENASFSFGFFGMKTRISIDPEDLSMGEDRFLDLGVDGQYQFFLGNQMITARASHIRERQDRDASQSAGMAENRSNTLASTKVSANWYLQRQYGGGLMFFDTRGSTDTMLYGMSEPVMGSAAGNPDTRGWAAELNYLPIQNVKLALRYTAYSKFNGSSKDYDGFGRDAKDNNNVFLMLWSLF